MKLFFSVLSLFFILTFTACGGGGGSGGGGGQAATLLSDELAGANCTFGGERIDTGIDSNGNGILDAPEITDTKFVCTTGRALAAKEKLLAVDAETGDHFGNSVSISGDYAIVGALFEDATGTNAGAAYIYRRTGPDTWDLGTKITAPDAEVRDLFGYSVSISEDYALVGATSSSNSNPRPGAAYIYRRTGLNTWDLGTKITAPDAEVRDHFGNSVSISGDYALVGAESKDTGGSNAGAAYIYLRTGPNTWDLGTKITPPDAQAGDLFGSSVSISGDYALVGAPSLDSAPNPAAGAAYIYLRMGPNTWDPGTKITAPDAQAKDRFGRSVSISGDYALVGAIQEDAGGFNAGAAYIYLRTGPNTWDLGTKITAPDAAVSDRFGWSVSISGGYVLVGNKHELTGAISGGAGTAYLYRRTGPNTWDDGLKITAPDAAVGDSFGGSVSISGETAIVGTSRKEAAYIVR